jgi:hypothetical protein
MTGEAGWRAGAATAAAVGVVVGARMADRRHRLRMARHQLWRRTALEEVRSRLERDGSKRRTRRVWQETSVPASGAGCRFPRARSRRPRPLPPRRRWPDARRGTTGCRRWPS